MGSSARAYVQLEQSRWQPGRRESEVRRLGTSGFRRVEILGMQEGVLQTSFNRGCKRRAGVKQSRRRAWSCQGKGRARQTTQGVNSDASLAC